MFKIAERRDLTPVTKLFRVQAPLVARKAQPGQFVIVRVREQGERIPLTIAGYDREKGTITVVVQEVGKTSGLACRLEEGQGFPDLAGPLGRPAEPLLIKTGRAITVGGGFGVAPILPIAGLLRQWGVKVTSIIGARTADLLILEDELAAVSDEVLVATDDGSRGTHGFVTQVLQDLIDKGQRIDQVIAIGPMAMMRAVAGVTQAPGLATLVSVDPVMVDGTGMCGACRLTVAGEVKFACVDGPLFDAHQVDFDEQVRRGKMYAVEEKRALEACRCGGGHQ
ncbi:MAG: sulfide/dihydroorotate dehydrogenase-like FAD/NAD-binding protein [bacterium]|nr:sulfide/dihydroorotate dehydrogenase-like FAD/NAD-binding protein [bacterium]